MAENLTDNSGDPSTHIQILDKGFKRVKLRGNVWGSTKTLRNNKVHLWAGVCKRVSTVLHVSNDTPQSSLKYVPFG